jgi:catechol 2,3-dioxygenase-like lactoylglutathione lyase family enzyme
MLLYTTVGTGDLARAVEFSDAVFGVLGHARLADWADGWAAWGKEYDAGFCFCICAPYDGRPPSVGNGTMFAFKAESAEQVRAFHAAGLSSGGTDEGAPGIRDDYGAAFYVAYLRDPDGNKIAAVFHRYDPSRAA